MPSKPSSSQIAARSKFLSELRAIVASELHERLEPITADLTQWRDDATPDDEVARQIAAELADLAQGESEGLLAIQRATATFLLHDDDLPKKSLSTLLIAMTQAFARCGEPIPAPPIPVDDSSEISEPDYRPGGNDRVWDDDFLQKVIDTVGDPIFVKDENHRWIFLNDAYCKFMGNDREELLGKSDYDFFPEDEADVFWEKDNLVFSTGETVENEESFTDAAGDEHVIITKKTMFVDSLGRKVLVGVIRDITERRRLEARLDVAKRLMSLGTLAGGVAHEINNPLSFVLANLEFLDESLDDPEESHEEIRQALDTAIRGADRVAEVVRGLRTFSQTDEELAPIDIREPLKKSLQITGNEIRHRARLIEDYGEVPLIDGNERSLGQIFLNLLINATQALETGDASHNEIRVETSTTSEGEAVVEISDTGVGIEKDVLPHIFDPFFSTKPVGKGTGLGLAICHSLVDAHDGHIDVESEVGQGSTFRLTFPATTQEPVKKEAPRRPTRPEGKKPRLLLIDDEPEVLASMKRRLRRYFRVDYRKSAGEALQLLRSDTHYDLIVCDVMMPDMNGEDFYKALSERHPHHLPRLVFISGGVFDTDLKDFVRDQDRPLLEKPVDITRLQDLVTRHNDK